MAFLGEYAGIYNVLKSKVASALKGQAVAAEQKWAEEQFEAPKREYYFIDKPLGSVTMVTYDNLNDLIDLYNEIDTSSFAYIENGKRYTVPHEQVQDAVNKMAEQFMKEPVMVNIRVPSEVGEIIIRGEVPAVTETMPAGPPVPYPTAKDQEAEQVKEAVKQAEQTLLPSPASVLSAQETKPITAGIGTIPTIGIIALLGLGLRTMMQKRRK